jgi:hypothetical protein
MLYINLPSTRGHATLVHDLEPHARNQKEKVSQSIERLSSLCVAPSQALATKSGWPLVIFKIMLE